MFSRIWLFVHPKLKKMDNQDIVLNTPRILYISRGSETHNMILKNCDDQLFYQLKASPSIKYKGKEIVKINRVDYDRYAK